MGHTALVLYESDGLEFNMDYYKKSHMPMVAEQFGPYKFRGYRVISHNGTADGKSTPYAVQAQLEFDTAADFQEALKNTGEKVLGDVPNFSNKYPTIMVGEEVLSYKA